MGPRSRNLDANACQHKTDKLRERARLTIDEELRAKLLHVAAHCEALAIQIDLLYRGFFK